VIERGWEGREGGGGVGGKWMGWGGGGGGGGGILGKGRGENKVSKKTEVRAEKGQRTKGNLGWYRDRGEPAPTSAPTWMDGARLWASFHPYPLFQWYPKSKDILSNLSMKCSNSLRNAETQHLLH